ncbi:nucleotidyltransferase domain-containing protein [Candidatus Lokiarchaeum ossiferum]|uniref:nucleotidyltransferase domain-containing protein n=1 Tax=Candidatus Lokiarchaeum ossiferum TaxID=2951803 RepID=UPI00352D72D2
MVNNLESNLHLFQRIQKTIEDDSDILAFVVYGSFARDEAYNDIDICIFLYPHKRELIDKKHLLYLSMFADSFDVHIFSDLPLVIQSRVLNDGKILCNKNFDLLFDIYCNTIKEFNLFEPHLNTYLNLEV